MKYRTYNRGYFGIQLYDSLDKSALEIPIQNYESGSGYFNIPGEISRILFTTNNTEGWYGNIEVTVRGKNKKFVCTNCNPGIRTESLENLIVDKDIDAFGGDNWAYCGNFVCEFREGNYSTYMTV